MKIISGSASPSLAQNIAHKLQAELINCQITDFANGEKRIKVEKPLKGEQVFLVQSLNHPVNDHIIELLLIADAIERLGANQVVAVVPWLAYSLQDKIFRDGEPISAKVVADLISNSFIHQVYLLDLHNPSIPGFFSVPTFHLSFLSAFSDYAKNHFQLAECVAVSPDFGGLKKAKIFAQSLGLSLANIDKRRSLSTGEVSVDGLQGEDVQGKRALLFDDCIVSGSTAIAAAEVLKQHGATHVHFFATHGLFAGDNCLTQLDKSAIDTIVISDSISHPSLPHKVEVLPSAPLFAQEIM